MVCIDINANGVRMLNLVRGSLLETMSSKLTYNTLHLRTSRCTSKALQESTFKFVTQFLLKHGYCELLVL